MGADVGRRLLAVAAFAAALAPAGGAAQDLTRLPELLEPATPEYPEAARPARLSAQVVLRLDLDAAGLVETATAVRTTTAAHALDADVPEDARARFEAASVAAAMRLRFSPAEVDGVGVPVSLHYAFRFEPPPAPAAVAPARTATVAPAVAEATPPPGVVNLTGAVREAGTRRAQPGALVVVSRGEDAFESIADAEGRFRFYDLASGEWAVVVDAAGFARAETTEAVVDGERTEVTYYLRPSPDNPYDVLVEGHRPEREVTRRALSAESAASVAGTMGDPVLALENLPGVARAGTGNGRPVRGSSPQDTRYYVEGLQILFDEHVGGFRSVLPTQMVEQVDFYPGNFSARYGRGNGGVVDVKLKSLDPDQLHGAFDVSLLDVGLYLEAPLSDTAAIAVAGRRSHIDAILDAAVPEDADVRLTTAPRWYDYQLLFQWRPSARHEVRVFGLGADDALGLGFASAADADLEARTDTASTEYDYQRLSVQHRYTRGEAFTNDLRVGLGRDAGHTDVFGRFSLGFRFMNASLRDEARWSVHPKLDLVGGVDARVEEAKYDVSSFRPPKEGQTFETLPPAEDSLRAVGSDTFASIAGFVEAQWRPVPGLSVIPGARVDYFGMTDSATVDPRLVVRYAIDEAWTVSGGVGLVHQPPELDEIIAPFGNPQVDPARALQASLGASWRPAHVLSADVTGFYKRLDHLVSAVDGPEIYRNEGTGRVIGLEAFLRLRPWRGLSGWLSYTLSRAERTDAGDSRVRLFDYDQTHILAILARYQLPANWSVGARWRYVTGRPTTPFTGGVFFDSRDAYEPIPGLTNASRLPSFHMLDLRVDKRWIFDVWSLSTYLSVSNAYNRANAEGVAYSFDYRRSEPVAGLPLLPIIGVSGEF